MNDMMREDLLALVAHKTGWSRRDFVASSSPPGSPWPCSRCRADDDHHRHAGPQRRRGQDPDEGRRDPGLPGHAGQGRAVPGRARRAGDLRRPRAHQGRLPPASPSSATWPSRPSCTPARATSRSSTDIKEIIAKVVSKVPDAQVMGDLDATVAWAKKTGKGDTAKLGITGFCWGGRIVWLYAAHNPDLKAGVAWYGRLVGDKPTSCTRSTRSTWPATLKAPVLGLYGGADTGIPIDTVEKMQRGAQGSRQAERDRPLPGHAARLPRRLPARATARSRPRTAGSGCWSGSRSTASRER